MSYTQTATSTPTAVGTVLLHPRPSAHNSGVLILVPLLADLHSESSTLRVIADTEPPRKPSTSASPPCASPTPAPEQQHSLSSIAGLPYKRRRAEAKCEAPRQKVLADSGLLSRKLVTESVLSCPAISDVLCKVTMESSQRSAPSASSGKPVAEVPPHLRPVPADAHQTPIVDAPCEPPPSRTLTLPAETWFRVLAFVFAEAPGSIGPEERRARAGLVRVSKTLKDIASPLFYAYPHFSAPSTLTTFTHVLQASDRAWDSLRRIPYSTPGRWVQALDLSRVACTTAAERLAVDTLLTQLFPLTPSLARLVLNSTVRMSRRAMVALAGREGAGHLRVLKGVKWEEAGMAVPGVLEEDSLLALVRASVGLEELEVCGPGLLDDDEEDEAMTLQLSTPPPTPLPPLSLPNLHSLMILSLPRSALLSSLVRSPLPSLRHLMVTPYDGVPSALTTALITAHGARLHTLAFHTPKTWPPIRSPTPPMLLHSSPQLLALSLTVPLPALTPPAAPGHGLRVLSLPRPDPTYLYKLEAWLYLGLLQCLEEVHMREVRWIRAGVSSRAAEAGVQGHLKEWKRRLGRWRVRVVDCSGREDAL